MENWLNSLIVSSPQEGFELAIKLSRMGVKYTQQDAEKLEKGRKQYAENPKFLIAASHVVAINFQTVSIANNHWKN